MSNEPTKSSAIEKAFAVIDAVASSKRPLSAVELGLETGFNRQTIHRLLSQLEDLELVQRDLQRERYRLGVRFRQLAIVGLSSVAASRVVHSRLADLVASVRETCNVGVMDGHEITYVDRVECDWPLRAQFQVGSRVPCYCTAIGKLLLANAEPTFISHYLECVPLSRLTQNTIVSEEALLAETARIRDQGYSVNNQEDFDGLVAVAVPIRNQEGRMIAGLAAHGPEARLNVESAGDLVPQLAAVAGQLGRDLFA